MTHANGGRKRNEHSHHCRDTERRSKTATGEPDTRSQSRQDRTSRGREEEEDWSSRADPDTPLTQRPTMIRAHLLLGVWVWCLSLSLSVMVVGTPPPQGPHHSAVVQALCGGLHRVQKRVQVVPQDTLASLAAVQSALCMGGAVALHSPGTPPPWCVSLGGWARQLIVQGLPQARKRVCCCGVVSCFVPCASCPVALVSCCLCCSVSCCPCGC